MDREGNRICLLVSHVFKKPDVEFEFLFYVVDFKNLVPALFCQNIGFRHVLLGLIVSLPIAPRQVVSYVRAFGLGTVSVQRLDHE